MNGVCCPPSNVCGNECCPSGTTCLSGVCCPSSQVCGVFCCPQGFVCHDEGNGKTRCKAA
jgi:hypothetical protein